MASMSAWGSVGACEIASTRIPPFISKPNEHRYNGGGIAGLLLSWGLQHNGSQDMHQQVSDLLVAKPLSWLVFPLYTCIVAANPQPWMPTYTRTKYCAASMTSAWVAPISPNTLFQSCTDTIQKSAQNWYIPFALQIWYNSSQCLATECTFGNEIIACKFDV